MLPLRLELPFSVTTSTRMSQAGDRTAKSCENGDFQGASKDKTNIYWGRKTRGMPQKQYSVILSRLDTM